MFLFKKKRKIDIIFDCDDFVVINKPSGFVVHEDGRTKEDTLVDWLLDKYPSIKGVGEMNDVLDRSGIVHRLDRETSGAMVVAKTQLAFEKIKKQFKKREVKKVYDAFICGRLKRERGTIDKFVGDIRETLGSILLLI